MNQFEPLNEFLANLESELKEKVSPQEAKSILRDTQSHLINLQQRFESEGDSPEAATLRALNQFDSPKTYALQFHRPWYQIKPGLEERPALYVFAIQCAAIISIFYYGLIQDPQHRTVVYQDYDVIAVGLVALAAILTLISFLAHLQINRLQVSAFLLIACFASLALNTLYTLTLKGDIPPSLTPDAFLMLLCILPATAGFLLGQCSKALWKHLLPEREIA